MSTTDSQVIGKQCSLVLEKWSCCLRY